MSITVYNVCKLIQPTGCHTIKNHHWHVRLEVSDANESTEKLRRAQDFVIRKAILNWTWQLECSNPQKSQSNGARLQLQLHFLLIICSVVNSTDNVLHASPTVISVAWYRGTTVAPRYHFSTVPVPSPLRYFLVPQYHKYRGSSARYLSVIDTQ